MTVSIFVNSEKRARKFCESMNSLRSVRIELLKHRQYAKKSGFNDVNCLDWSAIAKIIKECDGILIMAGAGSIQMFVHQDKFTLIGLGVDSGLPDFRGVTGVVFVMVIFHQACAESQDSGITILCISNWD
jgi:hypothetical protein